MMLDVIQQGITPTRHKARASQRQPGFVGQFPIQVSTTPTAHLLDRLPPPPPRPRRARRSPTRPAHTVVDGETKRPRDTPRLSSRALVRRPNFRRPYRAILQRSAIELRQVDRQRNEARDGSGNGKGDGAAYPPRWTTEAIESAPKSHLIPSTMRTRLDLLGVGGAGRGGRGFGGASLVVSKGRGGIGGGAMIGREAVSSRFGSSMTSCTGGDLLVSVRPG
jgi:hypothetical protein